MKILIGIAAVFFSPVSPSFAPLSALPIPAEFISNVETDTTICVNTALLSCQSGFASALGLSYPADWTDPLKMSTEISNLYLKGISGFLSVCQARQQLQQCLGDQYDACMNVPRFVRAGESPVNASAYVQLFQTMEFDCNGGFVQAAQNYGCILNVWTKAIDAFTNCYTTFNNTVTQDPSKVCVASTAYEKCMRSPMAVCGAESSWWQCERTRVGAGLDQLCPVHYCKVLNVNAPLSAHRKAGIAKLLEGNQESNDFVRSLANKKM